MSREKGEGAHVTDQHDMTQPASSATKCNKVQRETLTSINAFEVISGSGSLPAAADGGKAAEEMAVAATAAPAAFRRSPDLVKHISSLSPAPLLCPLWVAVG